MLPCHASCNGRHQPPYCAWSIPAILRKIALQAGWQKWQPHAGPAQLRTLCCDRHGVCAHGMRGLCMSAVAPSILSCALRGCCVWLRRTGGTVGAGLLRTALWHCSSGARSLSPCLTLGRCLVSCPPVSAFGLSRPPRPVVRTEAMAQTPYIVNV
jgi:hypothetical protein